MDLFCVVSLSFVCQQLSKIRNLGTRDETAASPFLTYDNSDGSSNFDANMRMPDDESRARVSFIGAPPGVISAADPPEFPDNFGETS